MSRVSASRTSACAEISGRSTIARLISLIGVSAVGFIGRLVDFVELHWTTRHDGRDRVLIDELDLTVPAQQHTEIVEPGDDALQLDAVDQEDRQGSFGLADRVEECVLQ